MVAEDLFFRARLKLVVSGADVAIARGSGG